MRVCMIGNSHLGPIAKASARRMREVPGLRIGHFIDRTYGSVPLKLVGTSSAEVVGSIKIEDKPAVPSIVDIAEWDSFVVVGLGFSLIRLVEKWADFQPDALPPILGDHLLVPELAEGYDDAVMDSTKALTVIRVLRSMTDKPVSLLPAPLPAEWVASRSGERFEPFRLFSEEDHKRYVADQFERQLGRIRDLGVEVVRPPQETVIDRIWTRDAFCLGNPSMGDENSFYARGDFYHMNEEYGEYVSQEIFRDSVVAN
jgi:hypothetical protein